MHRDNKRYISARINGDADGGHPENENAYESAVHAGVNDDVWCWVLPDYRAHADGVRRGHVRGRVINVESCVAVSILRKTVEWEHFFYQFMDRTKFDHS